MENESTMLAWHFLAIDRRLQFGHRTLVEPGRTYTAIGPLKCCQNGMHACRRALNALAYAPGPIVCRVCLSGELQHDTDKTVARSRQVLWMADATRLLHEFALSVATNVLCAQETWAEPVDPRSWAALDIKQRWLDGKATDQELATALAAAHAAATVAAWGTVKDDAWGAAWGAAKADAWGAAKADAWDAYNFQLETMLEGLLP